ncbi:hypothetical protein [Bauldia sp.]|uniref:hypothetical protein n=1 Tax=Bauldia sp. TaxID=2575872 RepID=UPI003BA8A99F
MSGIKRADVIEEYWYSIDWDVEAIWALDLPVEEMPIDRFLWHLDVPIWPYRGVGYVITPNQVLADPVRYAEEHERLTKADLTYPLDVYFHRGRWMILDGVHRLAKAVWDDRECLAVRQVPESAVTQLVSGDT